jgi:hypothetical protein
MDASFACRYRRYPHLVFCGTDLPVEQLTHFRLVQVVENGDPCSLPKIAARVTIQSPDCRSECDGINSVSSDLHNVPSAVSKRKIVAG